MRKVLPVLIMGVMVAGSLGGCGARRELQPLAGHTLPPAPFGREDRPKSDVLLTPPVQAKPQRNIELRSRSEDRQDDAFDLPPED